MGIAPDDQAGKAAFAVIRGFHPEHKLAAGERSFYDSAVALKPADRSHSIVRSRHGMRRFPCLGLHLATEDYLRTIRKPIWLESYSGNYKFFTHNETPPFARAGLAALAMRFFFPARPGCFQRTT
jgi:hypothetical protein